MKKAPVLFTLIIASFILTAFGIAGSSSIYSTQKNDFRTTPMLANVFTGIKDGIYPWDLFNKEKVASYKKEKEEILAMEEKMKQKAKEEEALLNMTPEPIASASALPSPTLSPTPSPTPGYTPRYEPLRETTYDEYMNHISADIYGDAGVKFAAEYPFKTVDITYFDDALFIGDSRTVGLKKYTDLPEHADFMAVTSMTIYKALESDFDGAGRIEDALKKKSYGKIYIMLGVNEMGTGTTEDYLEAYTKLVDTIHEISPESKIIIQGIMRVDKEKNDTDKVFNNTNIQGRNNAIATLADNENIFYIDVNEVVCDEEGNLDDELTYDHLHLMGSSNEIWKTYLMEHGV